MVEAFDKMLAHDKRCRLAIEPKPNEPMDHAYVPTIGHALAIADSFPQAKIIGVEPAEANDFQQSLAAGKRIRIEKPKSICDGLCSYDVGEHNWPILSRHVSQSVSIPDDETRRAMKWLYDQHGLRTEPSGAIATAALLSVQVDLSGDGDIVVTLSGRNVDEGAFRKWIDGI